MAAVWQSRSWNRQRNSRVSLRTFSTKVDASCPLHNRSAPFVEVIHVSAEAVAKLLKGLNPSKALGPDELHPKVLKELASELGPMFAHLFQQSIDTGKIRKEWSLANICPLYKRGMGPTKDRKGLLPPKRTEKNFRAPKRTWIWHFML